MIDDWEDFWDLYWNSLKMLAVFCAVMATFAIALGISYEIVQWLKSLFSV